jgi:hypothetical protein
MEARVTAHPCSLKGCDEPVRTSVGEIDLCEKHEHMLYDWWRDRLRREVPSEDVLHQCLDAIAGVVVGWEVGTWPEWVDHLWLCVNPLQSRLGIPLTDAEGKPL